MKKKILNTLKIIIPVFIGVYISWYFWSSFNEESKKAFLQVFKDSNYFFISISLLIGLVSHLARAHRWRYMLQPLGYSPSLLNSYNAIMIGYIANIVVPRMGEASRAGVLKGTDNVPFEKAFGTIVAERVIDVACLAIVSGIALLFNLNHIDDLMGLLDGINSPSGTESNSTPWLKISIYSILIIGGIAGVFFYLKHPKFRAKIRSFIKGFIDGMKTIFTMDSKWRYFFYTFAIWASYVGMFWITFYALPRTSVMPADGIMAAFVAGTIGFIIVQGGIGTYPIMVGTVVTFYLSPEKLAEPNSIEVSTDIGFGALVWATQTVLIVILGLISLAMVRSSKKDFSPQ